MFTGFTDSDFDAYAGHKWGSNAFNRERLEVKEKLVGLGRALLEDLTDDQAALTCEASAEHPALWNHKRVDAQHLFFARSQESRRDLDQIIDRSRGLASLIDDPSPQRSHLFLAVSLTHDDLTVTLRLHTDAIIDRHNLERKLEDQWQRDQLIAMVAELPAPFTIGVDGSEAIATSAFDSATVSQHLSSLARPLELNQSRWLSITRSRARAEVIAATDHIVDELRSDLRALLPIYRFIAWSSDNDHISMRSQLRERAAIKQRRGLVAKDRVRITSGVFAGRVGEVQAVDSRGRAKVLIGSIPITVEANAVDKL
jgi:transcription antitermination factor NusG